jgi:hypothetical protein
MFKKVIHNIWAIISLLFFWFNAFMSLNLKKKIQFHLLLSMIYFFYLTQTLKNTISLFVVNNLPLLSQLHAPITIFLLLKEICCCI